MTADLSREGYDLKKHDRLEPFSGVTDVVSPVPFTALFWRTDSKQDRILHHSPILQIEGVGLDKYVTDYFIKPLYDHRARLPKLGVNVSVDYVIDDHESVVQVFGGYHIPDVANDDDTELLKVLEDIRKQNQ